MTVQGLIFRLQAYNPGDQVLMDLGDGPEAVNHVRTPRVGIVMLEAEATEDRSEEQRAA